MKQNTIFTIALFAFGAIWGLTIPLTKIAASGGYSHFGLILWQMIFTATTLGLCLIPRMRWPQITRARAFMFLTVALTGTLLPGLISFRAAAELPAGVMAIVISLVPMMVMPIALVLGTETFKMTRAIGILLGAVAIVLLIGPETSLPDPSKAGFVLLALLSPLCYATEDNMIAKLGLFGLKPIHLLFGATCTGVVILLPFVVARGEVIPLWQGGWGRIELSVLGIGVLHAIAYVGYVWLVTRAGAVFAAQVAYLVTVFGVFWSIILLSEQYSAWVWMALITMLGGLFLVRPKESS